MGKVAEIKQPCWTCANRYGQAHGGNLLVCGIYPYGPEGDHCPDFEAPQPSSREKADDQWWRLQELVCRVCNCQPAVAAIAIVTAQRRGYEATTIRQKVASGEWVLDREFIDLVEPKAKESHSGILALWDVVRKVLR